MRVHTRLEYCWDGWDGYILIREEGFDYDGPVAECKGDPEAQAAEKSQVEFNQTMQTIAQTQFAKQQSTLDFMTSKLQPMINNPTGMSDAALAAARTSATDQNAAAYQNAQKTLQGNQALKSGDLPSGVNAQLSGALLSEKAASDAASQNQITMQNEQLKQSNYWNSMNALNGVSALNNPAAMAGNATSGAGAVANLSNAVTASSGPTIGSILGGVAGAGLGAFGSYLGNK